MFNFYKIHKRRQTAKCLHTYNKAFYRPPLKASMEWWLYGPIILAVIMFLLVGTIFEKRIELAMRSFIERRRMQLLQQSQQHSPPSTTTTHTETDDLTAKPSPHFTTKRLDPSSVTPKTSPIPSTPLKTTSLPAIIPISTAPTDATFKSTSKRSLLTCKSVNLALVSTQNYNLLNEEMKEIAEKKSKNKIDRVPKVTKLVSDKINK